MSRGARPARAVVFDLGNVFVEVDHRRALDRLRLGRGDAAGEHDAWGAVRPLVHRFESGELDAERFYEALGRSHGLGLDYDSFCAAYCDMFTPVEAMIDANAALRRAGVATYIFSNTSALHFAHIAARYGFMRAFDGYFLSYEIGCMKPHPRSYEAVESGTRLCGRDLVYVDDMPENVEAAARRGWHAIQHTTPQATLRALREAGLL